MVLPSFTVEEAEAIHNDVMANYPEEPSGIRDRGLLDSTLNRCIHAAIYEDADEHTQAATLLWGLVKNHPFIQGNKRTASVTAIQFLERAGYTVVATDAEVVDLVYAIDSGAAEVNDVADWFRQHT